MRNLCSGIRLYLAGPMDRVADGGKTWRKEITPKLEELGIIVLDPTDKKIDIGFEDDNVREQINQLKRDGKLEDVKAFKDIRSCDLRMTDLADIGIFFIDTEVHLCGTYEELSYMVRAKKPTLLYIKQGKCDTPNWLLFGVPICHIFDDFNDMLKYLRKLDIGEETHKHFQSFDLGPQTLKSLLKASNHDPRLKQILDEYIRKREDEDILEGRRLMEEL